MFTPRQLAYFFAVLYFILTFFFVGAPPLAVAVGTGAAWYGMLNLCFLAQKVEHMDPLERYLFLKGWL